MDTSDFKESYRMLKKIKDEFEKGNKENAIHIINSELKYIKNELEKDGIIIED